MKTDRRNILKCGLVGFISSLVPFGVNKSYSKIENTSTPTKQMLYRAVQRNVIFYDSDAKSGAMSKRLLKLLMWGYIANQEDNINRKPKKIYVGTSVFDDISEWQNTRLQIIPIDGLDERDYCDTYRNYMKSINYDSDDKSMSFIVLADEKDELFLLGSY